MKVMIPFRLLVCVAASLLIAAGCQQEKKALEAGEDLGQTSSPTPGSEAGESTSAEPVSAEERRDNMSEALSQYDVKLLDGETFRMGERRDEVLLLNVWATWCGPCRYEIPELIKLQQQHGGDGFSVIGVSVDENDPANAVRGFARDFKINYPLALDPEGRIALALKTSVLPTTVLVDRSGKIVWHHYGPVRSGDPALHEALRASGVVKDS